jgi:hypothetical protein
MIKSRATMRAYSWSALAYVVIAASAFPVYADAPGETFTCHFGRYGEVVINTRYPGSTITIHGRTYPTSDGSYFYQANGRKIVVFFGPNMRWWEFEDIRDNHCVRQPNKPLRKHK